MGENANKHSQGYPPHIICAQPFDNVAPFHVGAREEVVTQPYAYRKRKSVLYDCFNCFFDAHFPVALEFLGDGFAFGLVARLAEQGEHIALVVFDSRLVERIDAEHIPADAATFLKEVEKCAEVVFVDFGE